MEINGIFSELWVFQGGFEGLANASYKWLKSEIAKGHFVYGKILTAVYRHL